MPLYHFQCETCNKTYDISLSINEFIKNKNDMNCKICSNKLNNVIIGIISKVEKSTEQILMEIKTDVENTVRKIQEGDKKVIADIYGEDSNPYVRP